MADSRRPGLELRLLGCVWALGGLLSAGPGADAGLAQAAGQAPVTPRSVEQTARQDAGLLDLASRFQTGVRAYRAGEYLEAKRIWSDLLGSAPPALEPGHGRQLVFDRGALLFDLGNAAMRSAAPLEAMGYYEAALAQRPRDPAFVRNLARARLAAGSEPEQRGGWLGGLLELLRWPGQAERRWLALFGLGPLAIAALFEALAGGRGARRLLALTGLLAALASLPLGFELYGPAEPDLVVVTPTPASLRSEPRDSAARIGALQAGQRLILLDRYPGWVRVETLDGQRAWMEAEGVFSLTRGGPLRPLPEAP